MEKPVLFLSAAPALMVIQGLTNQFNLYKLISPEFLFEVFTSMTSIFWVNWNKAYR